MSTSTHSYDGLMLGPMLLDGRKLGPSEVLLVGFWVIVKLGLEVGSDDGFPLGVVEGRVLGDLLGALLGLDEVLGLILGVKVGKPVGFPLGSMDRWIPPPQAQQA